MPRPKAIRELPDGELELKIVIPYTMATLTKALAKKCGASLDVGLRLLLGRLDALLKRNPELLGPEWVDALKAPLPPHVDLPKFHMSKKTKSGYVGVYANGNGFRAHGKDPKTGRDIYLGQGATAEEAAWLRYKHYQEHKLPYGEREEMIDTYMSKYSADMPTAIKLLDETDKDFGINVVNGEPRMLGFDSPPKFGDE